MIAQKEKARKMEEKKKRRYSEAQNRASQKYIRNNYDMVRFRVRKDADLTKEDIQNAAERAGESVNAWIIGAIQQRIDRER